MRYLCSVSQRAGFGVTWEETNFRKACKAVRAVVEKGYQDDQIGSVWNNEQDQDRPLARWSNHGGRAVRVNV